MKFSVLAWDTLEYYHVHKSADWFWSLGIIAVSIAVLAVLFSNILFGIFILAAALAGGLYASRKPDVLHYELQPQGVLAGKSFYNYHDLNSFWVDDNHPHLKLVLTSKKLFAPHIIVPVPDDIHPEELRQYLLPKLAEIPGEETFLHKTLESLGL